MDEESSKVDRVSDTEEQEQMGCGINGLLQDKNDNDAEMVKDGSTFGGLTIPSNLHNDNIMGSKVNDAVGMGDEDADPVNEVGEKSKVPLGAFQDPLLCSLLHQSFLEDAAHNQEKIDPLFSKGIARGNHSSEQYMAAAISELETNSSAAVSAKRPRGRPKKCNISAGQPIKSPLKCLGEARMLAHQGMKKQC